MSVIVNSVQRVVGASTKTTNLSIDISVTIDSLGKVTQFTGSFNGNPGVSANGNFNGSDNAININCNVGRSYTEEACTAIQATIAEIIADPATA